MINRKPRILFICGSWPPIKCGVGDYLYNLTKHLSSEWAVITSSNAESQKNVFNIVDNWQKNDWPAIANKISEFKPDIIHYQYPSTQYGRKLFPNLLPRKIAGQFSNTPFVLTLHEYHDASFLGRKRIEFTAKPFKEVFVSNIEDKKSLGAKLINKEIKLVRIGSNIPIAKSGLIKKSKIKRELNPRKKPLVVYFGYIDSSKGVSDLVESMSYWGQSSRLILATEHNPNNPYHQQLNKRIVASGHDIHWSGYMSSERISITLQIANCVVLPFEQPVSMRRGSLIAAMEHGCAVVTTGPASEVLKTGENCILTPNNSASEIAVALNRLLDEPKLAKLIGLNAKKTSKQFSWEEIAKRHDREYQKLLY